MKTIFIVDDNKTNLMTANEVLDNVYNAFALPSADRMFKLLEKITPDLILLDVDMPEMDGFEAMEVLKSDERWRDIPVIFLTARQDTEAEIKGFELGALDFINKPFSPPVLIKRIESYTDMDRRIKESQQAVQKVHNSTIEVISDMVENRDKVTGGHIERTQKYIKILIAELIRRGIYNDEIATWDMDLVVPSAQLHDVGKIVISDVILNKPSKLTDDEFELIKLHCHEGETIINKIMLKAEGDVFLRYARQFAAYHHEKWDGSGYPRKLKGEEIPLEGRIMAVADVYDALVTDRPYKKAFTHDKAMEIIKNDSGTHFDPKIVEAFMAVADDFWIASMETKTAEI